MSSSATVSLIKRITPVLTHDGLTLARFSDRATAVRRAREWSGCIVGATHTDPGRIVDDRARLGLRLLGGTPSVPAGYRHPDVWRAFETARFVTELDRDAVTWCSPWHRRIVGHGDVWTTDGAKWWARRDDDTSPFGHPFNDAVTAFRHMISRH